MSTRIYNGFIFKKGITLEEIHRECETVRRMFHKQRQRKEATFAMQKAVAILDARTLGLPDRDERPELSPFSAATMALLDGLREASKTELRGNMLDFKFEIVAIPISGGKILGLIFTEQRDWEKMWLMLPFVRGEYHYQNQADPPPEEEVSSEAWAQRRKDWDEALPEDAPHGQGAPALCGITFTLCLSTGGTFPKIASSMRFLPKLENRVKAIAFDMLWHEYAKEQGIERNVEEEDEDDDLPEVSDVTAAYFEYRRWVQKTEGKARLEAKKLEVGGRLIHPIKAEHLQPKQEQRRDP